MNLFYSSTRDTKKSDNIYKDLCEKITLYTVCHIPIDELLNSYLSTRMRSGDVLILFLEDNNSIELLIENHGMMTDYRLVIIIGSLEENDEYKILKLLPRYICKDCNNLDPLVQVVTNIVSFDKTNNKDPQHVTQSKERE